LSSLSAWRASWTAEADATGDLIADAAIAAIALEHDGTVASLDRDFARFPSIQHVIPGC